MTNDVEIILTADAILDASDIKTVSVKCPEWGGTVMIRGLSGTERDEYEAGTVKQVGRTKVTNLVNIRARLVAKCAVNPAGEQIFKPSQVAALGKKNAAALDRCFAAASKLSGLSSKDVEELTGNFEGGRKEPSTSG